MTVDIKPLVMVHIRDDRETAMAFQEWCLRTRPPVLSAGRHGSVSGDSCCGYYAAEDEPRIRAWLAEWSVYLRLSGALNDASQQTGGDP